VNCSFDTPSGHLRRVKRAYDGDFSEDEVMDQLQSVPVLFIDDLGKESPTQWAVERLFDIIDARAAGMKPVVVTTNLGSRALRQRYGEPGGPMISRLCGNGAVAVRFDGPDRRLHG
jgi:DNA replication protein DnaC